MLFKKTLVAVAASAALIAPVAMSAAADAAPAKASTATNCPAQNTFFIGMAGSGELGSANADGTSKGDPATLNMGKTVYPIWTSLQKTFGLTSGEGIANVTLAANPTWKESYTADPVSEIGSSLSGASQYAASINRGATALMEVLSNDIHKCAAAQFILAGYSQGAMAIRQYVTINHGYKIRGIILVGDGYRQPNVHPYATVGGAGTGRGIGWLKLADKYVTPPTTIADGVPYNMVEVCLSHDIVCDTEDAFGPTMWNVAVRSGSTVISSLLSFFGDPSWKSAFAKDVAIHTSYSAKSGAGATARNQGVAALTSRLLQNGLREK